MRSVRREEIEILWTDLGSSSDLLYQNIGYYRARIETLGRALDHMDFERILTECNALRNGLERLGADRLREYIMELESAAYSRDIFQVRRVRLRAEEEMIRVLSDLTDFLREKSAA